MQSKVTQNTTPKSKASTNEKLQQQFTSEGLLVKDNRPEAIAQRKLQEIANNSKQVKQLKALQTVADNHKKKQVTVHTEAKENKTGLPDYLKSGIENLSGYTMNDVKVHYNSDKPAQLHAHAYAQGTDIHLASGQEKHLPHEAWHVVQQKEGRVQTTLQMKGHVNINDDEILEKEADQMGALALEKGLASEKSMSLRKEPSSQNPNNKVSQKKSTHITGKGIIQRVISARNAKEVCDHILQNYKAELHFEWGIKTEAEEDEDAEDKAEGFALPASFHESNFGVVAKALIDKGCPKTEENVKLVISYLNNKLDKKIKHKDPDAGSVATADAPLNTPVNFQGTAYTTRNALVDQIYTFVGSKANINQALSRMDTNSNVSPNTTLKKSIGGVVDGPTQLLRAAFHCSFGMDINGCTFFFLPGSTNMIVGLGHHVSNDSKKYNIVWAASGYPTGRFDRT